MAICEKTLENEDGFAEGVHTVPLQLISSL